jgi:hypothetical protein
MGFLLRLFVGGSSLPWIIGGIMLLLASGFTWLKIHDYNVWEQATNAFNAAQEQLFQQKQEEFNQQTLVINDNGDKIKQEAFQKEQDIIQTNNTIQQKAVDLAPDETRQSSIYLKNIMKQLQDTYGVKK